MEITAFAPASVSNVACGFDMMGFALEQPGDTVTVRSTPSPGVRITKITGTTTSLPLDPTRNTAGAPILAMLKHLGTRTGIEIEVQKGLPPGSGIGSSAASAVAAAVACNALLEAGLSREQILGFALEGEKIASQAVHVDNLSPCLWGGFVLVRSYNPIDIVQIPVPDELRCTVILPEMEIATSESRKRLPKMVSLADSISQAGNAAGLIAGLMSSNLALIGRSLHDVIAEPVRRDAIPGFADMKNAALAAGALGCSISGSGPALFALSASEQTGADVGVAMGRVLEGLGMRYSVIQSGICKTGARVIH
jgi:homoserine kinase